jgi:hypothetical protein
MKNASSLNTTPAKAGVQYRAARTWAPAFAGVEACVRMLFFVGARYNPIRFSNQRAA